MAARPCRGEQGLGQLDPGSPGFRVRIGPWGPPPGPHQSRAAVSAARVAAARQGIPALRLSWLTVRPAEWSFGARGGRRSLQSAKPSSPRDCSTGTDHPRCRAPNVPSCVAKFRDTSRKIPIFNILGVVGGAAAYSSHVASYIARFGMDVVYLNHLPSLA